MLMLLENKPNRQIYNMISNKNKFFDMLCASSEGHTGSPEILQDIELQKN